MGKYDKLLLCTDFDNTLAVDGKISAQNMRAIEDFCDNGGHFCIATGRQPEFILDFFDRELLQLCPIICCNGACIYDFKQEKVVFESALLPQASQIADMIPSLKKYLASVVLYSHLKSYTFFPSDEWVEQIKKPLPSGVHKILMISKTEGEALYVKDRLKTLFGDMFDFSRSWSVGLEILNKDATKGASVKRVMDMIGKDTVSICVGDFENDITMIQAADIGCAVENAIDELKAAADYTVCHAKDNAIEYIINNICPMI